MPLSAGYLGLVAGYDDVHMLDSGSAHRTLEIEFCPLCKLGILLREAGLEDTNRSGVGPVLALGKSLIAIVR